MFIISKEVHQATTYDAAVTNVIHNFKAYKRNKAKKKLFFPDYVRYGKGIVVWQNVRISCAL